MAEGDIIFVFTGVMANGLITVSSWTGSCFGRLGKFTPV